MLKPAWGHIPRLLRRNLGFFSKTEARQRVCQSVLWKTRMRFLGVPFPSKIWYRTGFMSMNELDLLTTPINVPQFFCQPWELGLSVHGSENMVSAIENTSCRLFLFTKLLFILETKKPWGKITFRRTCVEDPDPYSSELFLLFSLAMSRIYRKKIQCPKISYFFRGQGSVVGTYSL